jgi:hypothetical protein
MGVNVNTTELKLEAANISWGRGLCRSVQFVADVAGSLDGEYWDLNTLDKDGNEVAYYVWLNNGTTSVDPAPAGKTAIEVSYTNGDSADTIAAAFESAIDAMANKEVFVLSSASGLVTYENVYVGPVTTEVFTNAPALTFETLQLGFGGSLGGTNDGIELTIETQSTELKVNQKGELVLGEIFQGQLASITCSLAEMTKERWETVIGGVTGDIYTPAGGTRLVGGGVSRLFQNLFDLGGRMTLNPIRLGASDRSEDVIFWKSAPKPESVSYSGTEQQGLSVTFTAYNDNSKPDAISLWAQGDWTQDL